MNPETAVDQAREQRRGVPISPAWWLALCGGVLFLFILVPVVALVYRALEAVFAGAQVSQSAVLDALQLSLVTTFSSMVFIAALGTPLAYILARYSFPGKGIVDTVLDVPIVLPPAVAGLALLMAFGRQGVLGGALHAAGIDVAFTTVAVVMAQVFVAAPFYVKSAKTGFSTVNPELERVSYTLGVSRSSTFRRVTLPLALPALAGGAVMAWARALGEFGATIMFAGSLQGKTQTMPLAIYAGLESGLGPALVLSLILVVASFSVLLVFKILSGRTVGAV
ncbi:MAG: ABC transporter permease [Chloroflexi bacterium]|nr:ABC transporter permease [Chloroflexota bacterium]